MKVGETETGAKTGDAKTPSTTSATAINKVATIPEEPKKGKKTTHKNKVASTYNYYAISSLNLTKGVFQLGLQL